VVLSINHAAVSGAIALSQGVPFRRVWELIVNNSGASLHDILIAPVALAVAFLYVQFGVAGILVVILPMLFIRHSYATASQLRIANEDLLTALVKAIETRDPYTSGHSQRVSELARRIADELGLPRRTARQVEMAALLHDIGQIEAKFTDILAKPHQLTPEERSIIESHVIVGENLLRDLSSVPEDVVRAVRHHHEREDGRGYPDGLVGREIPLGAKIISICDAVDAMLSNRPYRRALPVSVVREQLAEHSGSQFDSGIAEAVLSSTLVEEYANMMWGLGGLPGGHHAPGPSPSADPLLTPSVRVRRNWISRVHN
jgi:putative nucleotidyltransferase with HDIG domain